MKQNFILRIITMLSYLYPEKLIRFLGILNRYLYNEKLKRKMKKAGEQFRVFLPVVVKGLEYIEVGNNFTASEGMTLQCYDKYEGQSYRPSIRIGNNAYFGMNCHIGCIDEVIIGDNFLAGGHVYITDHGHGKGSCEEIDIWPIKRELYSKGKVEIGNNVWLGENVVILSGVTVGDNVTVGANSVVTKDIPSNCVAVGAPAKVIKSKV